MISLLLHQLQWKVELPLRETKAILCIHSTGNSVGGEQQQKTRKIVSIYPTHMPYEQCETLLKKWKESYVNKQGVCKRFV